MIFLFLSASIGVAKTISMTQETKPLLIGGIIFPEIDQADFTGPFEVLSSIPNSKFLTIAKTLHPVRDIHGLILTPGITFDNAPQLDVLLIPGGYGINSLMKDPTTLAFIQKQTLHAKLVITVCTGSLLLGATGFLKERHATTHWAAHHLLKPLGAIPVYERVVHDGNLISAAGVTSGIDAALLAVSLLCDKETAEEIQLSIEYALNPPFQSGTPESAPASVLQKVKNDLASVTNEREVIIQQLSQKL